MNAPSPPLLPLLRSENRLRVLAAVVLEPTRQLSVEDLVEQTGVPQPGVSRELAALLRAGLAVAATERGRRVVPADVVVVGDVDVRDRAETAGRGTGREVDVSVLSDREREQPAPGFVRHLRGSPLTTLLPRDGHDARQTWRTWSPPGGRNGCLPTERPRCSVSPGQSST